MNRREVIAMLFGPPGPSQRGGEDAAAIMKWWKAR
jgi:hypothetical protein